MINVVVAGDPAPQGSKTAYALRAGTQCSRCRRRKLLWRPGTYCPACHSGVPIINLDETAKGLDAWRAAVTTAARVRMLAGAVKLTGPLQASMTFTLARPKSHYTSKGKLSAEGNRSLYPDGTPDLSKLLRATEDGLTDAQVWEDDSRIVDYTRVAKLWPLPWAVGTATIAQIGSLSLLSGLADADALSHPGAVIRVRQMIQPIPELDLAMSETSQN